MATPFLPFPSSSRRFAEASSSAAWFPSSIDEPEYFRVWSRCQTDRGCRKQNEERQRVQGVAVEGMQSGGGDGGERDDGCELAGVVFPRGKHEHILARGLFRQIGDCCGGERKGSSPHHQHRYYHQSCRRNRTPPCWSNEDRGFSPKFAMEPKRERER